MTVSQSSVPQPFPAYQVLGGYNCLFSSFRRLFIFNGYAISEAMLLGLGAGVGFVYWQQKNSLPFLGGRGNVRHFHTDISQRTGVQIKEHTTTSPKRAEKELLTSLESGQPVVLYADMAYLPYLGVDDKEAHFGEHAITVVGYDRFTRQVVIADIDPKTSGLKKGNLHTLTLADLARARASTYQPFPPRHRWFTFDFSHARPPQREDIYAAITQAADAMLHPPIKNLGLLGIHTAIRCMSQWGKQLTEKDLRRTLYNLYIYTEIGGTGGGLFRYLYSHFLEEATVMTGDVHLGKAASAMHLCANHWRQLAQLCESALDLKQVNTLILTITAALEIIAALETNVWHQLWDLCQG